MSITTFSLQSGSQGNAIYVEADGVRLLIDAGISGVQAERRLKAHGREIREVDALLISHDHNDHVRCAGVYQRKFGLPIYITKKSLAATWAPLGKLSDVRHFEAGQTLEFGNVRVQTVPTPHDAADGVVFVVEHAGRRLGILSDLGHVFDGLSELLASLDAAYLESNYDEQMLEQGPYPRWLKQRIRGPGGHLSNAEAAELLADCGSRRAEWFALAHLSEKNNDPELALETHRSTVGNGVPLHVASRYEASSLLTV